MNGAHSIVAEESEDLQQITTFFIDGGLYGIEVMRVQEVSGPSNVAPVPLAPDFVRGLVNLRGQIATSVGLRQLFGAAAGKDTGRASVVCRIGGNLVSLTVDSIGDVVGVDRSQFEATPQTIPEQFKRFLKGIYKMNGVLLSVIDLDAIAQELN